MEGRNIQAQDLHETSFAYNEGDIRKNLVAPRDSPQGRTTVATKKPLVLRSPFGIFAAVKSLHISHDNRR